MLMKIGGLARALYILLAILAGFVALGTMDVALVLIVLGLISGISLPRDRMVLAGVSILALPLIGAALSHIPTIGAKLTAVTINLQLGMCGALAMAMAVVLYGLVMEGLTGLVGPTHAGGATAAATS